MRKQMSKTAVIARLIIASIVTVVCILLFKYVLDSFIGGNATDISSRGWSVTMDGREDSDVNLYRYRLGRHLRCGDTITLERTLPDTIGEEMILTFEADTSAVSVSVDGQELYSYGRKEIKRGVIPGSANHMIQLPDTAAGSTLKVMITAGMSDSFYALPAFFLVPSKYSTVCYTRGSHASALAAIFLFTMGVIMLLAAMIMGFLGQHYPVVFAIGAIAFGIGIWTLCSSHLIELFSTDYAMNTRIQYISLYVSVIPLVSIMLLLRGMGTKKWQKICVILSYVVLAGFCIVVAAADIARAKHPASYMYTSMVVILSGIVLMTAGTLRRDRDNDLEERIISIGLAVLYIGCVYDLGRYFFTSRVLVENRLFYVSILPFAAFFFIILMVIAYLVRLHGFYMKEAEKNMIDQIAFTDAATGLKNRTYSNHRFEELGQDDTGKTFQIVSFDINGLTKVNEKYGHSAGDQMIRDGAEIIKTAFEGVGEIIRMGGDEFIVITYDGNYRDVKHALSRMERLESAYELKRKYEIRISYGIASSDEKEGLTPEAVYHRANERMYAMKKETRFK